VIGRLVVPAAAALALAAPAAADHGAPHTTPLYPETAPGGVLGAQYTIVRQASGSGVAGGVRFALTPDRVRFGEFASTKVTQTLFGLNAVKLRGVGVVGGRRVEFTAIGVHNVVPGRDFFRISWNHGAARGGFVTTGSLFIR
jgi:hypothetical protein